MAIEEDKLPAVMPVSVPRVKTNDGTPTTFLIDWEESTRNWYRNNAVALDSKLTEVKATADNASAAVTVETNARITADGALADQITTVAATFDDATANGQIYFGASAGPAGAVATYSLFLTAGNANAGFQAIAKSGGGAAVGFLADQFVFTDSGTMQNVFDYSGGQFVFTGNVAIDGNLVVTGTIGTGKITNSAITTGKVEDDAITRGSYGTGTWTGASCPIKCNAGDTVFVTVSVQPTAATVGGPTPGRDSASVTLTGSAAQTLQIVKTWVFTGMSGGIPDGDYYWAPSCRQFVFVASSTGNLTAACGSIGAAGETEILITALAVSK